MNDTDVVAIVNNTTLHAFLTRNDISFSYYRLVNALDVLSGTRPTLGGGLTFRELLLEKEIKILYIKLSVRIKSIYS